MPFGLGNLLRCYLDSLVLPAVVGLSLHLATQLPASNRLLVVGTVHDLGVEHLIVVVVVAACARLRTSITHSVLYEPG